MHLPLPRTPSHPDPRPRTCQVVAESCKMDPTPTPTPNPSPNPVPPPNQVVAKSCKMVPVMLMGYVVSGRRYTCIEYAMATSP